MHRKHATIIGVERRPVISNDEICMMVARAVVGIKLVGEVDDAEANTEIVEFGVIAGPGSSDVAVDEDGAVPGRLAVADHNLIHQQPRKEITDPVPLPHAVGTGLPDDLDIGMASERFQTALNRHDAKGGSGILWPLRQNLSVQSQRVFIKSLLLEAPRLNPQIVNRQPAHVLPDEYVLFVRQAGGDFQRQQAAWWLCDAYSGGSGPSGRVRSAACDNLARAASSD